MVLTQLFQGENSRRGGLYALFFYERDPFFEQDSIFSIRLQPLIPGDSAEYQDKSEGIEKGDFPEFSLGAFHFFVFRPADGNEYDGQDIGKGVLYE